MSSIPTMLAASSGQQPNAGLISQFLGAHNAVFLYAGAALQASQATGGGVYQSTASQWLSQSVITGAAQTVIGSVGLQLSTVGGSPTLPLIAPLTVAVYSDSGGVPGSVLATATVSGQYVYDAPFWLQIPFGLTVTPSTLYHLVVSEVGATSHYYAWQQAASGSGAATAPDGVTWTTSAYGLMYEVFDSTATGQLLGISEDGGQLITQFTYTALGQVATVAQYAVTQSGGGIYSSGTLSYTNGLLTGVN